MVFPKGKIHDITAVAQLTISDDLWENLMKFGFCLVLFLCTCLGLCSCYGALDAGINAAYLQSSDTNTTDANGQPAAPAYQLRDTVYLNDGSVIHGFIVEETPGVSLSIKTKSGNIFTYQMADVAKITHAAKTKNNNAAADNSNSASAPRGTDSSADNQ